MQFYLTILLYFTSVWILFSKTSEAETIATNSTKLSQNVLAIFPLLKKFALLAKETKFYFIFFPTKTTCENFLPQDIITNGIKKNYVGYYVHEFDSSDDFEDLQQLAWFSKNGLKMLAIGNGLERLVKFCEARIFLMIFRSILMKKANVTLIEPIIEDQRRIIAIQREKIVTIQIIDVYHYQNWSQIKLRGLYEIFLQIPEPTTPLFYKLIPQSGACSRETKMSYIYASVLHKTENYTMFTCPGFYWIVSRKNCTRYQNVYLKDFVAQNMRIASANVTYVFDETMNKILLTPLWNISSEHVVKVVRSSISSCLKLKVVTILILFIFFIL